MLVELENQFEQELRDLDVLGRLREDREEFPWYMQAYHWKAFFEELLVQLREAEEDLRIAFGRVRERLLWVEEGPRKIWFPFLHSAYNRARYEPQGRVAYRYVPGTGCAWRVRYSTSSFGVPLDRQNTLMSEYFPGKVKADVAVQQ